MSGGELNIMFLVYGLFKSGEKYLEEFQTENDVIIFMRKNGPFLSESKICFVTKEYKLGLIEKGSKKNKRYCKICHTEISEANRSGYCRNCETKTRIKRSERYCEKCGKEKIATWNKTGLCKKCFSEYTQKKKKEEREKKKKKKLEKQEKEQPDLKKN